MSEKNKLATLETELTLVNGTTETITPVIQFKDGVKDIVQTQVGVMALKLIQGFQDINRGYFKVLPTIAEIIAQEPWKQIKNCGSCGKFIVQLTGCSPATASELTKVASRFYTGNGAYMDWIEFFTYSELLQLTKLDDDGIKAVKQAIGEKHTRKDVVDAITEYKARKYLEDNGIDTDSSEENTNGNEESTNGGEESTNSGEESTNGGEESTNGADNSTVETDSTWLSVEKIKKVKDELLKSSKGKLTKTEMQEVAFRALQTIKAYESIAENPFEN